MKLTPHTYAYRYPDGIRYGTGGRAINGSRVIETVPLYWGPDVEAELAAACDREKAAIAAALESLKTLSGKWRKNGHHPFATSLDEAIAALITTEQSAARK